MLEVLKDLPLQLLHILLGTRPHFFTASLTRYIHASQDGLDASKEFLSNERFRDVIIRPIPDSVDTIFHAGAGSQENKWDRGQMRILSHEPAQLKSIRRRHHDIRQDKIR